LESENLVFFFGLPRCAARACSAGDFARRRFKIGRWSACSSVRVDASRSSRHPAHRRSPASVDERTRRRARREVRTSARLTSFDAQSGRGVGMRWSTATSVRRASSCRDVCAAGRTTARRHQRAATRPRGVAAGGVLVPVSSLGHRHAERQQRGGGSDRIVARMAFIAVTSFKQESELDPLHSTTLSRRISALDANFCEDRGVAIAGCIT
jgi:hypothetical protein